MHARDIWLYNPPMRCRHLYVAYIYCCVHEIRINIHKSQLIFKYICLYRVL